jgi:hypothetical protein
LRAERATDTSDGGATPATGDPAPATHGDLVIGSLNSAVVVDRRGIIRSAEQRYQVRREEESTRWVNRSFAVTNLGTATVDRPEWMCVAERNGHLSVP